MSTEDTHTVEAAGGLTVEHPVSNRVFNHDFSVPDLRDPIETMPHNSFTSSNVHSALYDFGEREMSIRYLRTAEPDAVYLYLNVPASAWQSLVSASSKGREVNANIAYEFRYFKTGRDDLPSRAAIDSDLVRRFYYDP